MSGASVRLIDRELYDRGMASAVASWECYARGADGAAVVRAPGVAAAVFPAGPERDVYNNAVLERDLGDAERAVAVAGMEEAYAAAGVTGFAAWVHESDVPMIAALDGRGYRLHESTRAMGMSLDDLEVAVPEIELGEPTWPEYLRYLRMVGLPPGLLADVDAADLHIFVARLDGASVATTLAFDHDGDCGIYNVSTLEPARRRGLGTALTALQLHAAKRRGCSTASLQSTDMGERMYAAVGFRDLGLILEYVPDYTR